MNGKLTIHQNVGLAGVTPKRATITVGPTRAALSIAKQGPQGPPGEGFPPGGDENQILAKASDASYDTEWIDLPEPVLDHGGLTGLADDDHKQYQRAEPIVTTDDPFTITTQSLVLTAGAAVTLPDAESNAGRSVTVGAATQEVTVSAAGTDVIVGLTVIGQSNGVTYTSVNIGGQWAWVTQTSGPMADLPAWYNEGIDDTSVVTMVDGTPQWEASSSLRASAIVWAPSLAPSIGENVYVLRWEPGNGTPLPDNPNYAIVQTEVFTGTWPGEQDDRVLLIIGGDYWPSVYARADANEFVPIPTLGGTAVTVACEGLYGVHPSVYVGTNFDNSYTGGTAVLEPSTQYLPVSVASDFVSIPTDYDGALSGLTTGRLAFDVLDKLGVIPGETSEPHGFPNRTDSAIQFANVSREFTITPTGASFDVWCSGTRYTKTSAETITLPNTPGLYYIHYTAGSLGYSTTYFDWPVEAPVAYVYWNTTTQKAEFFADERHGITLDWQTHEYLHRTRGAAFSDGFSIGGFTLGGDGSSDTHAQADLTGGTFFDEDLQVDIVSTTTPALFTWEQDLAFPMKVPTFYLSGTAWQRDTATPFPLKAGTTRPVYNLNTGGTWSTPDATNNRYIMSWVIATNNLDAPVIAIVGQSQHSSLNDARGVTWDSLSLPGFPVYEMRPLYKLIFLTQTGMTNSPKASLAAVQDLRGGAAVGSGSVVSDHGLLAGLGDDDHPQYALADGTRGAFDPSGSAAAVQSSLTTHVGLTSTAHGGIIPAARQIIAGTGLTGGGDLSADRTLAVSFGSTAGTAAQGNDSRLSDSRSPSGSAGGDLTGTYPNPTVASGAITSAKIADGTIVDNDISASAAIAQSKVAGLTTDLAGKLSSTDPSVTNARTPTAHKASHSTGGTDALAPSDIGAVPTSRNVTAGTGLTGGGDLSADRTLSVSYGTTAGTAAEGNDSRLSDARTPLSHVHSGADITSGTIAQDRLGTGSAGLGKRFLADDQTYKPVAGGFTRAFLLGGM